MAAACGGEAAAADRALCAFSPRDRRFFAISGPDGRLRVWETANSRLQHEYVPSAHLSAACTCLAWAPPGGRPPPSKVWAGCEGRNGAWLSGRGGSEMGLAMPPVALTRGRGPLGFTPPCRRHVAGVGVAGQAGERSGGVPVWGTGQGSCVGGGT